MIEIRFHQELYDGFAIDEAAKVYQSYAELELVREEQGYVVRLTARAETIARGIDEATLSAELSNYALGKTIERRGGPS